MFVKVFGMGIKLIETTDHEIKHICNKCKQSLTCEERKNIKNKYMYCVHLASELDYKNNEERR